MITDNDVKKLKSVFATKEELKDTKFELEEEIRNSKNEVLNSMDKVMGELKAIRQEQIFHHKDHDRIDERLTKIETNHR